MPKIPGAAARQSRTIQKLARFTPPARDALAAAALVLFDAINGAYLVVNDALTPDQAEDTGDLLDSLYLLQDAIHGNSARLGTELACFLAVAESGVCRGA